MQRLQLSVTKATGTRPRTAVAVYLEDRACLEAALQQLRAQNPDVAVAMPDLLEKVVAAGCEALGFSVASPPRRRRARTR